MEQDKTIRVLLAKGGMDGHSRGVQVVAQALREAGMEVIYTGPFQSAEMIVRSALTEDVDIIALSSMNRSHKSLWTQVMNMLKEKGANIPVVGGGIIPDDDKHYLESIGITGNYGPGTSLSEIVEHVRYKVREGKEEGTKH